MHEIEVRSDYRNVKTTNAIQWSRPRRGQPKRTRRAGGLERGGVLARVYAHARAAHGHQRWWPARTPFEVCVGAILTQTTAWRNVERAIENLRGAGCLTAAALLEMPEGDLAQLIRPVGYFNVKARRLRAFVAVLVQEYGGELRRLFLGTTPVVSERLLAIPGIGPETADSMLLYAGGHASFVVDAYTRRIFSRHGWCPPHCSYAELQMLCATRLRTRRGAALLDYWQDYHAQLVRVGKEYCRPRECRCAACPLRALLPRGGPVCGKGA